MGAPKLLLVYKGKSLLEHAIHKANHLTDSVTVVVGAYKDLYTAEAEDAGASVVYNPTWQEGLGSSLRTGVAALEESVELALVLLADQPFVDTLHLDKLIKTQRETAADLVFSGYDSTKGPPMAMAKTMFEAARKLKGSCGAKALIGKGTTLALVKLEAFEDIDTPDDVKKLKKKQS